MKNRVLLFLMIISLNTFGCGQDTGEPILTGNEPGHLSDSADKNAGAYIAEPLIVTHGQIYCDAIYQNYLYYICNNNEGGNSYEEALVIVRMDLDNPDTPKITPLDIAIPTDNSNVSYPYMMLSINDAQTAHVLFYQYGDEGVVNIFWYQVDENGKILSAADVLKELGGSSSLYGIGDFAVDGDGNAYIAIGNEVNVIKQDGSLAFELTCGDSIGGLFTDNEGKVNVYYAGNMGSANYIAAIDFSTQALTGEMAHNLGYVFVKGISAGDSNLLFFANEDGIYDYDLTNGGAVKRFDWPSVGIAASYGFSRALPLSDGRVLYINDNRGSFLPSKAYQLIRLMTADEIAAAEALKTEISIITLGTVGSSMTPDFRQAIVNFNQSNPDKRIEIIEYGSGDMASHTASSEYDEGMMLLNMDIATGKCPDILHIRKPIPWSRYAELNILQDLTPYLDADSSFDWADYQENIVRAYEIDGGLYGIPLSYIIDTLVVRQSDIGDKKEWNMDELIAFADSFGAGNLFFDKPTKTAVLDICLRSNGNNIIDWTSEGVGFNREFVVKILEFANRFIDDDKYSDNDSADAQIQSGEIRILQGSGFPGSTLFYGSLFGEPAAHIGYPSESGSGYIINANESVALSAKCRDKEGAWSFISSLLVVGEGHLGGMLKKSNIQATIESMVGYQFDVPEKPVDADDIASYYDMLGRADEAQIFDIQIENIIKEEAAAYFSGDKSIADAVDIIENRVGIYVMEWK